MRFARALAAFAALTGVPALASDTTLDAAADCGRIEREADRLACYDRLFRGATGLPVASAKREAEFGLTDQQIREREGAAGTAVASEEIESTVLRVNVSWPNLTVLELENAQKWRLLETSDLPAFRAGDHVTIRRGALGSYLASASGRPRAWRVRRVE